MTGTMGAWGAASLRGNLVQNLLASAVSEPGKPEWRAVHPQPRAGSIGALLRLSKPGAAVLTLRDTHLLRDGGPRPVAGSLRPKGSQAPHT